MAGRMRGEQFGVRYRQAAPPTSRSSRRSADRFSAAIQPHGSADLSVRQQAARHGALSRHAAQGRDYANVYRPGAMDVTPEALRVTSLWFPYVASRSRQLVYRASQMGREEDHGRYGSRLDPTDVQHLWPSARRLVSRQGRHGEDGRGCQISVTCDTQATWRQKAI